MHYNVDWPEWKELNLRLLGPKPSDIPLAYILWGDHQVPWTTTSHTTIVLRPQLYTLDCLIGVCRFEGIKKREPISRFPLGFHFILVKPAFHVHERISEYRIKLINMLIADNSYDCSHGFPFLYFITVSIHQGTLKGP